MKGKLTTTNGSYWGWKGEYCLPFTELVGDLLQQYWTIENCWMEIAEWQLLEKAISLEPKQKIWLSFIYIQDHFSSLKLPSIWRKSNLPQNNRIFLNVNLSLLWSSGVGSRLQASSSPFPCSSPCPTLLIHFR